MHSVNQIRKAFLDYFAGNKHEVVNSAPLVPHNDPTLMFTNAGMVPFKDVFTQNETRDYKRATSSQKCVRAGGKHNDLDNVGYTARHHTFFEMLGNFSFGDYFKEDAIKFAWEFLTKELALPKDKLLITVYHTDDEAFDLWKKIASIGEDKIIRIPTKDNFWAMGDTGPCGPCSEIFYDHGAEIPGGPPGSKDEDGDRFIEIWNLVFMQFEQLASGERVDLPAPSIDTGMGLERIAATMQNVHDNYDIDLFKNLIEAAQDVIRTKYESSSQASYRVLADHLRSVSFLLADGVMPSNEGRGYVLRRIMRRAMRHARQLGANKPVIYQLVPALITQMGDAYPELQRAQNLITEIIKLEEERFGDTIDRGLKLLDEEVKGFKSGDVLKGETAFKLYDTYGFPLDLTMDILKPKDIVVDEQGFSAAMDEQKQRARAAWKGSGESAAEEVWFDIKEQNGATEFLGYDTNEASAQVIAVVKDSKRAESASKSDEVSIILNQTPFYGESGGQEGDKGIIIGEDFEAEVTDTSKVLQSLHVHICKVTNGSVKIGDTVTAKIDKARRDELRANHSATHILHSAMREVLGDHVTQKGSLVSEDRLRFDVSHPKAITQEELDQIEQKVNLIIRQNSEVATRVMPPEDAIEAGAMALFGEKYGDEVRVVNMGIEDDNSTDFSVELCGGTHVNQTGDIGLFKIISECAIAAGVRRVEAISGKSALEYVNNQCKKLSNIALQLKVSEDDLEGRIKVLIDDKKQSEKKIAELKKQIALGGGGNSDSSSKPEEINGVNFIGKNFGEVAPKDLRGIASDLGNKNASTIVVAGSSFEGKASIIIIISSDLHGKYKANELITKVTEDVGAKGAGGKEGFAQTGGNNPEGIDSAISKIKEFL